MNIRSALRRKFSFLGKSHFVAIVLLGVALCGMYFVVQRVEPMFDRGRLLPKERYDITSLQIAPAAAVCPGLSGDSLRSELESCQKSLATSPHPAFRHMVVPTLDEILKTQPPRFVDLLKHQGLDDIAAVISRHELYVVEFRIPRKYFSRPQILDVRNVLTFHMILKGAICIEGECSRFRSRWEPYAQGFELVLPENHQGTADESGDISVWYFIQDGPFTAGIAMEKGIFVAKNIDLNPNFKYEGMTRYGKPIFFAATFGSLILAVIFFCLIQGYVDYAMLGCFAFSLAFYVITENSGLFTDFEGIRFHHLKALAGLHVFSAAVGFALAVVRVGPWRVFGTYILVNGLALYFTHSKLPLDQSVFVASWPYYTWTVGIALVSVPPAILAGGIAHCLWLIHATRKRGVGRSHGLDLLRRAFFELAPLAIVLYVFGLQVIQLGQMRAVGTEPVRLIPNSILLLFAALGIMSANSMIRQMLVGRNAASTSEADLLQQRLSPARLADWQAQKREGVFIDIDVAGITAASERIAGYAHDLMTSLGDAVARLTNSLGFHWIYDKTAGDQWLVALSRKHKHLSGDFSEVVKAIQDNALALESITEFFSRHFGVEIALHINVIAIRDYSLGPDRTKPYDVPALEDIVSRFRPSGLRQRAFQRKPDFFGEELNFILKYIGKPPGGTIGIAGPFEFVTMLGSARRLEEQSPQPKNTRRLSELSLAVTTLPYKGPTAQNPPDVA